MFTAVKPRSGRERSRAVVESPARFFRRDETATAAKSLSIWRPFGMIGRGQWKAGFGDRRYLSAAPAPGPVRRVRFRQRLRVS